MDYSAIHQEHLYIVVYSPEDGWRWIESFLGSPVIDIPEGQLFASGELISLPCGSLAFGMICVGNRDRWIDAISLYGAIVGTIWGMSDSGGVILFSDGKSCALEAKCSAYQP